MGISKVQMVIKMRPCFHVQSISIRIQWLKEGAVTPDGLIPIWALSVTNGVTLDKTHDFSMLQFLLVREAEIVSNT